MQETKKQLEILLVNYFRHVFEGFPKCKVVSSESPDFLLKLNPKKQTGLELTRVNPTVTFTCVNDEQVHELRERIILQATELFRIHSELPLFVKILFSESKPIIPERELTVAARLASQITKATKDKSGGSFFVETISSSQLPEGIKTVLVVHHPALKEAVWEEANNLGISEDILTDVVSAIEKKDKKLFLYQKRSTDANWLLITSDRLRGRRNYNVQNQLRKKEFKSEFDHVFLLDLIKGKVFKLV